MPYAHLGKHGRAQALYHGRHRLPCPSEGFGPDYELNNHTAYCETCASIANVYWNHRMFLATGDSRYEDILERALYNGVISGVSLSGDRFFYDNPLESMGAARTAGLVRLCLLSGQRHPFHGFRS